MSSSGKTYIVPPRDRFTVNEEDLNELMGAYSENQGFRWRWINPAAVCLSLALALGTKTDFRELPWGPKGMLAAIACVLTVGTFLWTLAWLPWNYSALATKAQLIANLKARAGNSSDVTESESKTDSVVAGVAPDPKADPAA